MWQLSSLYYFALEAAVRIVTKCALLAHQGYVEFDEWGERNKFLYTKRMKRDVFTQHWKKRMQWLQKDTIYVMYPHMILRVVNSCSCVFHISCECDQEATQNSLETQNYHMSDGGRFPGLKQAD